MSDDPVSHLPQSPRSALEADIVQLAPDGLAKLFDESQPRHRALTPAEARIALQMHRAGRDAAAIAERSGAPLPAVIAFIESIRARASRRPEPAPAVAPGESAPPVPAAEPETDSAQPGPLTVPPPMPKLPQPDIELTALQLATIRRLRKARVPASAIAFGMRLTPDQVMRIAGEIP